MNQVETLKYIALNGNPIGTPAEADYNNYKSDPTFRKLALQATSGGNLIGSPLENEYTQYRDTVNGGTQSQQPIPLSPAPTTVVQGVNRSGKPAVDINSPEGQARITAQEQGMGDPFANVTLSDVGKALRYPLGGMVGLAGMAKGAVTPGETALGTGNEWLQKGLNNQGWQGVASDPINLTLAIPGLPEASILAKSKIAKGLLSAGQGIIEGAGLSAADQALNNGNIQGTPTLVSGLIGGVSRPIGNFIGSEANKYNAAKAADKATDPLYENIAQAIKDKDITKVDQLAKQLPIKNQAEINASNDAIRRIDPTDVLGTYFNGLKSKTPGWEIPVLQKVKEAISLKSPVPVNPKDISDAEARLHLTDLISKANQIKVGANYGTAPYELNLNNLFKELPTMVSGGYLGNLVGGLPGMAIGGALGNQGVRNIVQQGFEKGVIPLAAKSPSLASGITRVAPVQYGNTLVKKQDPLAPDDQRFFRLK